MGFLHMSPEVEIHTTPKTWEKWVPIVREKDGKTETFQNYEFLKYFAQSKYPYNSQNIGKVKGENYGKTQTFQS